MGLEIERKFLVGGGVAVEGVEGGLFVGGGGTWGALRGVEKLRQVYLTRGYQEKSEGSVPEGDSGNVSEGCILALKRVEKEADEETVGVEWFLQVEVDGVVRLEVQCSAADAAGLSVLCGVKGVVRATVRLRSVKSKRGAVAYLTVKGPSRGMVRSEFEYRISLEDFDSLVKAKEWGFGDIDKIRYLVEVGGVGEVPARLWEVDVFDGKLRGLVLAEVELESEDAQILLPEGVGLVEVTEDMRYTNASLALLTGVPV